MNDTRFPNHSGTRLFIPISDIIGLPPEQVNLLASYIISMIFGTVLRDKLHLTKMQPIVRHLFSTFGGIFLLYFCFGKICLIHFMLATTLCYFLMNSRMSNWHDVTFVFMMKHFKIFKRMLYF